MIVWQSAGKESYKGLDSAESVERRTASEYC